MSSGLESAGGRSAVLLLSGSVGLANGWPEGERGRIPLMMEQPG